MQFLRDIGLWNIADCRIEHIMCAVQVRPGALTLQAVRMVKNTEAVRVGGYLATYKAKADRATSCAIGIGADVAKRHNINGLDVQARKVHLRIEDSYGFDITNIYLPPTASMYYSEEEMESTMAVTATVYFVGGDMILRPTAATVAELWPQFLKVPPPTHHAGWKDRHDQRSRATAASTTRTTDSHADDLQ